MKKNILFGFIAIAALVVISVNCNKPASNLRVPPELAHFGNETSGTYFITAPGVTYEIPVGVTTVSDKDRTISFTVTSPTGAVLGTDYTLSATTSVTIPKGQTTGSIIVTGQFNNYQSGQKDSLIFTLQSPDVLPSDYNNTFKLLMRGPCFDGDVSDITVMGGVYAHATDPDDPVYTVTVSNFVSTGPTTATAKIANLWDAFNGVDIVFDWTDPANTKVSIARQITNIFYSTANNQPISIRTSPGQPNKFSVCANKITMIVDLIVENYPGPGQAAFYEQNYPMTINR